MCICLDGFSDLSLFFGTSRINITCRPQESNTQLPVSYHVNISPFRKVVTKLRVFPTQSGSVPYSP